RPIHHRMPVILHPADYDQWLDVQGQKPASLQPLLRPYEAAAMQAYPVSTTVNSPRNETPACLEPLVS
ncbi:MAG: SOS response-associated peptidase family protein, partial [Cyanobacteria bacterium J06598_1]